MCINCITAARRVDAGLQRVLFQLCRGPCWVPEYCVRFEVPSAATVSWDMTPYNLINICQRSEGTCFIRQDGGRRLLRNTEKIYQTKQCQFHKTFVFYNGLCPLSFCPPCTLDLLLDVLYSLFSCLLYSLIIFIFNFVSSLLYLLPMFSSFYFIWVWPLSRRLLYVVFIVITIRNPSIVRPPWGLWVFL